MGGAFRLADASLGWSTPAMMESEVTSGILQPHAGERADRARGVARTDRMDGAGKSRLTPAREPLCGSGRMQPLHVRCRFAWKATVLEMLAVGLRSARWAGQVPRHGWFYFLPFRESRISVFRSSHPVRTTIPATAGTATRRALHPSRTTVPKIMPPHTNASVKPRARS